MSQNIYDHELFFEAYSQLPRSVHGLSGAPEWPSIQSMLPNLDHLRVLDLGCGFGWFCRWAREHGAAIAVGIDVSERMLARADSETTDPAITYLRSDLECVELPTASFDLAYSSLSLHYIEDLAALFAQVHAALVPGGRFVFSVEHPILTAPSHQGWITHPAGHKTWPVDHYLDEGVRSTDWLANGVIKQHRTLATYINLLIGAGFAIEQIEEWSPSASQIAAEPDWSVERERPFFLLISCNRE
jgi:SAM-dependent methyltransferase